MVLVKAQSDMLREGDSR